nr:hypothetical protein [Cupriavidus sp. IK-TO18]
MRGHRSTPRILTYLSDVATRTSAHPFEGELDDISGRGQTHAAHDLCRGLSSRDKRLVTIDDCTHYDLFRGPAWRTEVFPRIFDMI